MALQLTPESRWQGIGCLDILTSSSRRTEFPGDYVKVSYMFKDGSSREPYMPTAISMNEYRDRPTIIIVDFGDEYSDNAIPADIDTIYFGMGAELTKKLYSMGRTVIVNFYPYDSNWRNCDTRFSTTPYEFSYNLYDYTYDRILGGVTVNYALHNLQMYTGTTTLYDSSNVGSVDYLQIVMTPCVAGTGAVIVGGVIRHKSGLLSSYKEAA